MAGNLPTGRVVIYDDDHYYMGSVLAERLRLEGLAVSLVTNANVISEWSGNTGERSRVQKRLMDLDVDLLTAHEFEGLEAGAVRFACSYSGRERMLPADALVVVSCRRPVDTLYHDLVARLDAGGSESDLESGAV